MRLGRRRVAAGRAAALAATLVLTLGLAACGSDDGDGDGDGGGRAAAADGGSRGDSAAGGAAAEPAAAGGTSKQQIEAVYGAFVNAFYAKDPAAICATMTPALQREIAAGATCEQRFEPIVDRPLGDERPFIVEVAVSGPKAKASVKTKTSAEYPARFAKQDGEWRISGGAGLGADTAIP